MYGTARRNLTQQTLHDLYRLNLLITGIVLLCALIFLLLLENPWVTMVMAIKSGAYILLVSYIQVVILRYCTRKYSEHLFRFRLWRFGITFVLGVALYLLFWEIFASWAGILERSNDSRWLWAYAVVAIIINSIIAALHDFVVLRRNKIETDLENSRLQMRNTEAENLLLRQQIQPHFLFNALNTLKVLIKTDPEKGEYYLVQLADFLRVAVSHHKRYTATLEEELSICRSYMDMQKIRFGESLQWDLIIEDDSKLSGIIPSFSLQPLLENAIKHNALSKERPLKIVVRQTNDVVEISNTINPKTYGEASIKSGLSNLADRYHLLTGKHIDISNDEKVFSVRFKMLSHEGSHH